MRLNRANSLLFAGLLYAGGLVVISVSPITEWRFIPEMPWEYLLRGWPKYWTSLDVLLNVLAYIPLGLLIGRAVSHRLSPMAWGPLQAFVFTVCASVLLSILLEAVQTYLPSRRTHFRSRSCCACRSGPGSRDCRLRDERPPRSPQGNRADYPTTTDP